MIHIIGSKESALTGHEWMAMLHVQHAAEDLLFSGAPPEVLSKHIDRELRRAAASLGSRLVLESFDRVASAVSSNGAHARLRRGDTTVIEFSYPRHAPMGVRNE